MVNVVPATIILYENDKHPVKYKSAVAIAEVLEIDKSLLLDDYTAFIDYPFNILLQELRKALKLNQEGLAEAIGVGQLRFQLEKKLSVHQENKITKRYCHYYKNRILAYEIVREEL